MRLVHACRRGHLRKEGYGMICAKRVVGHLPFRDLSGQSTRVSSVRRAMFLRIYR